MKRDINYRVQENNKRFSISPHIQLPSSASSFKNQDKTSPLETLDASGKNMKNLSDKQKSETKKGKYD